jgi:hypothetical protein
MLNSGIFFRAKINILTLVLSEKKFLNETKNHNPPLQVKWLVPYWMENMTVIWLKADPHGTLFKTNNHFSSTKPWFKALIPIKINDGLTFQNNQNIPTLLALCCMYIVEKFIYMSFLFCFHHIELEKINTADITSSASYLDLHLETDNEDRLRIKL